MVERRVRCDAVSFNAAMAKCEDWERVLVMFTDIAEGRVRRSAVSFNTAMSACEAAGKWQCVLQLLQRELADVISFSVALSASLAAGRSVLWLFEEMSVRRISLPERCVDAALAAAQSQGKRADVWAAAVELVDALQGGRHRLRRAPLAPRSFLQHLSLRRLSLRRMLRSLARPPRHALRANVLKATPSSLRRDGWRGAAPFHQDAFSVDLGGSAPGQSEAHLTGEVYFQELSSMLPAAALDAWGSSLVLDLCAAPGSKSTQLAASSSAVVANDPDRARAARLRANLLRCGVKNCLVTCLDGRGMGEMFPGIFSRVLVDVPCSCEGNARKSAFGALRAGQRDPDLEELQFQLAKSGWAALSPGGLMVYSTCTLNHWENEGVCQRLLHHGGVHMERVELEELLGKTGVEASGRLWPQSLDCEGFFVACFRKAARAESEGVPGMPAATLKALGELEVRSLRRRAEEQLGFWPAEEEDICHEGPNKEVWLLDRRLLAVPAELLRHCWDQGLLLARKEGDAPDDRFKLSEELLLFAGRRATGRRLGIGSWSALVSRLAQRTTDPAADEEHRLGDSRLMCKAFSIGETSPAVAGTVCSYKSDVDVKPEKLDTKGDARSEKSLEAAAQSCGGDGGLHKLPTGAKSGAKRPGAKDGIRRHVSVMPVKQELTTACTGHWKTELFNAPCEAPLPFVYGCCCICCATYQQRTELLDLTGEPYVCCAGLCPCCGLEQPQDRSCLCIEVCCCPGLAMSANRFMVQTRFDKENTPCDDCIITGTCLFVCALDIVRCFIDIPRELDFIADCLVMTVQGCMHAQQQIEIDEVKRNGYQGMSPQIMHVLPPSQQMMMSKVNHGGGPGAIQLGAPQPQHMGPPMGNQPVPVQVSCGNCRQVFGAPQQGMVVQCPFCQTPNSC
ncbi:unnamed protein product [Effrenium voratum]|nr:unnamed protein product [Effrenium voratum]